MEGCDVVNSYIGTGEEERSCCGEAGVGGLYFSRPPDTRDLHKLVKVPHKHVDALQMNCVDRL